MQTRNQRNLDEHLEELYQSLLKMGSLVEESIKKSTYAFLSYDKEMASEVKNSDKEINDLEITIDKKCEAIFALFQPVASDLRLVMVALKINNDLERIGDMATSIASKLISPEITEKFPEEIDIEKMCMLTQQMLKDALNSFVNKDEKLASAVILSDEQINNLKRKTFKRLIPFIEANPEKAKQSVKLILVARTLERIADLSTNIAEEVIFLTQAKIVKHHHNPL
ncbi:MAG: phosphate transport system regulatory protein PhoU [Calditrichaeota bacterium]|nr:MAG: phosphate transport system regulatory protein PhoU [Calditrichota bacterium]